jgi:YD repeat-containing protein
VWYYPLASSCQATTDRAGKGGPPASTIDGAVYTVDAAGNRTSKADQLANITTNCGYDAIYELLQATQGGAATENCSYDPVGNRLNSPGVSSYTTNSSNEVTAAGGVMYDNNGNETSKINSSGITNYAWDYENRLTSVTLPNSGGTVSFKYDPFGRRIYKQSPTAMSIFVYDGDNLIETVNETGSTVARHAQGQNIDEPLAMVARHDHRLLRGGWAWFGYITHGVEWHGCAELQLRLVWEHHELDGLAHEFLPLYGSTNSTPRVICTTTGPDITP